MPFGVKVYFRLMCEEVNKALLLLEAVVYLRHLIENMLLLVQATNPLREGVL